MNSLPLVWYLYLLKLIPSSLFVSHGNVVSSTASPVLSSADFPALIATPSDPSTGPVSPTAPNTDPKSQEKAERKAAKKVAAAEKAAERQKLAQERALLKAAERAKVAQEKVEKDKAIALKAQEKLEKENAEREKEKERENIQKAARSEKSEKEAPSQSPQAGREDLATPTKKVVTKQNELKRFSQTPKPSKPVPVAKPTPLLTDPAPQVPLLSKKPKKIKPISKPIKVVKEDSPIQDEALTIPSLPVSDAALLPTDTSSIDSHSHSLDRNTPTSIEDLLDEIDIYNPAMDLANHPFFDTHKLNPASSMPLEYGPLVHALSALSVGGGSFANNMPSGSIDNAVSSFQQLLETLTQTISDLLRLLPRTTWDDSSSFDGVLRDMLKGDDFLDDAGDESRGKEDEVAALTLALERRARWMEVQLSKLEELHRDINTAAVRAVLSFNDNGWDRHAVLPRVGNSLRRFDNLGLVEENGVVRSMNSRELEEKLAVAREAAVFAEAQVREAMERVQVVRPTAAKM
jgi:CCR4-NOT transcription complex subunit 4